MKKAIILIMAAVLFMPSLQVFATTETPDKPVEVDCPPNYVGQNKCFYVTNPKVKNSIPYSPEMQFPEEKEIKTTSSGKKITNHPYTWAIGTLMGYVTSQSETANNLSNEFWSNVNQVDLMAGNIANRLSESSQEQLQNAWNSAVATGSSFMDLSSGLFNELFGATQTEFDTNDIWNNYVNDSFKRDNYTGHEGKVAAYVKEKGGVVIDIRVVSNTRTHTYYLLGEEGSTYYKGVYVRTHTNSTATMASYDGGYFTDWLPYEEAMEWIRDGIDNYSSYPSATPSADYSVLGSSGSSGAIGIPVYTSSPSIPKTVTVDGQKYYEVENPSSPMHPSLQPVSNPSGGSSGGVITGHALIDGDGYELSPDTGTKLPGDPITNPVQNPVSPDDPNYSPPVPPGTPDSNNNPDLPKSDSEDINEDFGKLFTNKFPFSLPWDIYNMISAVTVEPERPELNFDETYNNSLTGQEINVKFSHDFAWMDSWIGFFRAFILIGFSIFLILGTRRLLGGAQ